MSVPFTIKTTSPTKYIWQLSTWQDNSNSWWDMSYNFHSHYGALANFKNASQHYHTDCTNTYSSEAIFFVGAIDSLNNKWVTEDDVVRNTVTPILPNATDWNNNTYPTPPPTPVSTTYEVDTLSYLQYPAGAGLTYIPVNCTYYIHPDGSIYIKVTVTNNSGGTILAPFSVLMCLNPISNTDRHLLAAGSITDGTRFGLLERWIGFYYTGGDNARPPAYPGGDPRYYNHSMIMTWSEEGSGFAATGRPYYKLDWPATDMQAIEWKFTSNIANGASYDWYIKLTPNVYNIHAWQDDQELFGYIPDATTMINRSNMIAGDYNLISDIDGVPDNDWYFHTNGGSLITGIDNDDNSDGYDSARGLFTTLPSYLDGNSSNPKNVKVHITKYRGDASLWFYLFGQGNRIKDNVLDHNYSYGAARSITGDNSDWELHESQKGHWFTVGANDYYEWHYWLCTEYDEFDMWWVEKGNFKPFVTALSADINTEDKVDLTFNIVDLPTNDGTNDGQHRLGRINSNIVSTNFTSDYVQYAGPFTIPQGSGDSDTDPTPAGTTWNNATVIYTPSGTSSGFATTYGDGIESTCQIDWTSKAAGYYYFRLRCKTYGIVWANNNGYLLSPVSDYYYSSTLLHSVEESPVLNIDGAYYIPTSKAQVNYTVSHPNSPNATISLTNGDFQYIKQGDTTWTNCSIGAGSILTNIATSPSPGISHFGKLFWDVSDPDLHENINYKIRLRLKEDIYYSDYAESNWFTINKIPVIDDLTAIQDGTRVGISYTISDDGSDICTFIRQVGDVWWYNSDDPTKHGNCTLSGPSNSYSNITTNPTGVVGLFYWEALTDLGDDDPASTYIITARIFDGLEYSEWKRTTVSVSLSTGLYPPYNLTSHVIGQDIGLDWSKGWFDNNGDGNFNSGDGDVLIDDYYIYRRNKLDNGTLPSYGDPLPGVWTGTTYLDTDVIPGIRYYYIVRGLYNGNITASSNETSSIVPLDPSAKEYDLSPIVGVHHPKEPLLMVNMPEFYRFVDISKATTPALKRHSDLELKLGYSIPKDAIPLSVYSTPILSKENVVELIDMTDDAPNSVKLCEWQDNDDQWHIQIKVDPFVNTLPMSELFNVNSTLWTAINDRISNIPSMLISNTSGYSINSNVYLGYDFYESPITTTYIDSDNNDSVVINNDIVITNEQAKLVSPSSIKVDHFPIKDNSIISIYIYNTGEDGFTKYNITASNTTNNVNGIIDIGDIGADYLKYTMSDIIYVDYTYVEEFVTYTGFTNTFNGTDTEWVIDLNPRAGHGMTYEGVHETLEYIYGSNGCKWNIPGNDIYSDTLKVYYRVTGDDDYLVLVDSSLYELDAVKGIILFSTNSAGTNMPLTPTSELIADYISGYMLPSILLGETIYIYALPSYAKVISLDGTDSIGWFNLLTKDTDQTLQHTFNFDYFNPLSNLYDPTKVLIAKVRISPPLSMANISSMDVRSRGGAIDEKLHVWDKLDIDGKIISGNLVLLIRVPEEITAMIANGYLTEQYIRDMINKHIAAGTTYIIEYLKRDDKQDALDNKTTASIV